MPPPKQMPGQFYCHDNLPLEMLLDADPPPSTEKASSLSENKIRQSVIPLTRSSVNAFDFSVVSESEFDAAATEESKRGSTQPFHKNKNNDNRRRHCASSKAGLVIISLLWIISGLLVGNLILLRPPSNHWNLDEISIRVMTMFLIVAQGVIILGTLCGAIIVVYVNVTRLLNAYMYFTFIIPAIQGLCYAGAAILYQDWSKFSILIAIGIAVVCISIYFSMIIQDYVQKIQESKTVFLLTGPVSGEVVIV